MIGSYEGATGTNVGRSATGDWVRIYGAGSGTVGMLVGSIPEGVGDISTGDFVVGTSVPESGIGVVRI